MGDPVGGKFEIYYTQDGGNTWTAVDPANNPDALSGEVGWTGVYTAYNNTAWFGTNKGRIYKTTDKGITWTVYNTGLSDISDINFNNETSGIAIQKVYDSNGGITTFSVKKTTDGGANWTSITPGSNVWKTDWAAVPGVPGKYFSVGTNGATGSSIKYGSSYSLDYGATWTVIDTGVQYICVEFYNDNVGWAGGFSINATTGGIYKWDASTYLKPVSEIQNLQIYPNPASNFINIKSNKEITKIEIFNSIGQSIISEKYYQNELMLNIGSLKQGIYLLKIYDKNGNTGVYKLIKE
jgi:hypothetical protein